MSDQSKTPDSDKEMTEFKTKDNIDKLQNPKKMKKKHKGYKSDSNERKPSSSSSQRSPKIHRSPKRNIAQNRLKKLRAKLDSEIKIKEKVQSLGIERLVDESVVKIGNNSASQNKLKAHKIPKNDAHINSSGMRNLAAGRLMKLRKELQKTIVEKETEMMMDVDMDVGEANDKSFLIEDSSQICSKQVTQSNHDPLLNSRLLSSRSTLCSSPDYDDTSFVEEISKIRDERSYQALHSNFAPDIEMNLALPVGDLFIVIDTNIFLSHLKFLENLLKNSIPPYKSHVLVVPWPVIQEIDYAMKKPNASLALQARYANNFINRCVKERSPRLFGQTLTDFKENFKNAVNIDDFILQYCMKFASFGNNVVLLTNDRNLCTKAMINQLKVYTKGEFQKSFNL